MESLAFTNNCMLLCVQRRLTEEVTKLTAQEAELLGYVSQLQEKCGLV